MNTIISQLSRVTTTMPESFQTLKIVKAAKTDHPPRQDVPIVVLKTVSGLAQFMCQPALPLPGIVQRMNIIKAAFNRQQNSMTTIYGQQHTTMVAIDMSKDEVFSPKTCPIVPSSDAELDDQKVGPLAAFDFSHNIGIITNTVEPEKASKKKTHPKKAPTTATILSSVAMCLMFSTHSPSHNSINMAALTDGLDLGPTQGFALYQPQASPTIPFHRGPTLTSF